MRIAIDCRIWTLPLAEEQFQTIPLVRSLLNLPSDHSFYLVFDQSPPTEWKSFANAQCLVLKPVAHTAATRAVWYDLRLPALLSAHQIELFLGASGYISLRTPVKQILLLHDVLGWLKPPALTGWPGNWYPRRLPAMLEKAFLKITSGRAQVQTIPSANKLNFTILPFCPYASESSQISESEKLLIKQQITDDSEYFVCQEGWQTLDDAIELLLAFSAFKKRMQTAMKLVLLGEGPKEKEWPEKLETFRYRADILLHESLNDTLNALKIVSAAYGLIHLPSGADFRLMQYAICTGTPVITWPHMSFKEIAGPTVCYCTDQPGEALAQNLMRLYKDEKWRSDLIRTGLSLSHQWDLDKAARSLLKAAFEEI